MKKKTIKELNDELYKNILDILDNAILKWENK